MQIIEVVLEQIALGELAVHLEMLMRLEGPHHHYCLEVELGLIVELS